MQDKIIILKNTKNGVVKDTIMSVQDTLRLDLKQEFLIPDNATVKTITDPPSGIELVGLLVAIIGGLVGVIAAIKTFKDLFKKDESQQNQLDFQQNQINELIKLNKLFEKRVRMTVKPHLWSNGSGYRANNDIHIQLDNRGEMAFYSGFETLEGKGAFTFQEWNQDIPIKKDGSIKLSGNTTNHPNQTYFKIKVFYYDKENYKYETIIEWNNARVRFLETNEL